MRQNCWIPIIWAMIMMAQSRISAFQDRYRTATSRRCSRILAERQVHPQTDSVYWRTSSRRSFLLSFTATSAIASLLPVTTVHAALLPSETPTSLKYQPSQTRQESISGFVAGGLLTATKTVVKYPLDTATVRLQMPGTKYSFLELGTLLEGSFQGIASPLIWNIPAGAVFFAVKDATKQALKQQGSLPMWANTMLAVGIAQFPYWAVRNPSEVVKTKQQAGIKGYNNISSWEAFQLVKSKASQTNNNSTGIEGFYVGYWENILYAYPADVIKFLLYDQITGGRKDLMPVDSAIAGALATALSQFVTTPLDVVRNRIMAGTDDKTSKANGNTKLSYGDTLLTLAKEEGLTGLFAGASPRIGKAFLSGAIQFATYEETKQQFAKYFLTQ